MVAVASAQAADLPTRKGAPAAEYVRVCSITVAGKPIVGLTLPGSDTCFKIGGYITGQIEGGNLSNSQTLIYSRIATRRRAAHGQVITRHAVRDVGQQEPRVRLHDPRSTSRSTRPPTRPTARWTRHIEMQFENGNGFDTTGDSAYINLAYVTWAGHHRW